MTDSSSSEPRRSDTGPFIIIPVWLLDSQISHGALRLYGALSVYADNRSGTCWPSRTTLAERLGVSTDSILRWSKELVAAGALLVLHRKDPDDPKNNRSNLYTILRVDPRDTDVARGSDTDATTPSTDATTPPSTDATLTRINTELDKDICDSGDIRDVFDAWIASTGREAKRTKLDDKRRRLIRNALGSYPVEDVVAAVTGWERSAFHRGENEAGKVYNDLGLLLRNSEKIEYFRDQVGGTVGSGATAAWQQVVDTIQRYGRNHRPEWDTPTRTALQAAGGYYEACNSTNLESTRREFVAAFKEQS